MYCKTFQKPTLFCLLIMLYLLSSAQSDTKLATNHLNLSRNNDTLLLNSYCSLQLAFAELNPDSSIYYGYKALELSKKLNQKFYVACTLSDLGFTLLSTGDYSNALNVLLEASKLAEDKSIAQNIMPTPYINEYTKESPEANRVLLLGYIKNSLALLYGSTRNPKKQVEELLGAKKMVEQGNKNKNLLYSLTYNIANAYLNMNQLDSAMYFQRMAMEIEQSIVLTNYSGASFTTIANIFYKKGNVDSAKKYFLDALFLLEKRNTNANYIALTQAGLANVYRKNGKGDSALYFAKAAVKNYFSLGSFVGETVDSYNTLAQCFNDNKQYDSAFFYMMLSKVLSDSLNKTELDRLSKFQQVGFDEQLQLKASESNRISRNNKLRTYVLLIGLFIFSLIACIFYRNNKRKQKANLVLQKQKDKVEHTLQELKATQTQLIQSEKMASLGELTAGIAHEIQNPLNFVNNFSEVSNELLDEMKAEMAKGNYDDANEIANGVKQNLEKINHHGKRADAIVKGMLQHSRNSSGVKEPTNINALCNEYLRLSYHGLRAKDKSFNATMKTDFDTTIGKINMTPQDIGRVILNLLTNAFYAVNEKKLMNIEAGLNNEVGHGYEPTVSVTTKKTDGKVEIRVSDNGNGIPQKVLDKIFQPFFTTKPTGQGTGLGLSLSYDIITKAHGGELKVETKEKEGSTFIIQIPMT